MAEVEIIRAWVQLCKDQRVLGIKTAWSKNIAYDALGISKPTMRYWKNLAQPDDDTASMQDTMEWSYWLNRERFSKKIYLDDNNNIRFDNLHSQNMCQICREVELGEDLWIFMCKLWLSNFLKPVSAE